MPRIHVFGIDGFLAFEEKARLRGNDKFVSILFIPAVRFTLTLRIRSPRGDLG
jgi:hypothetical protein